MSDQPIPSVTRWLSLASLIWAALSEITFRHLVEGLDLYLNGSTRVRLDEHTGADARGLLDALRRCAPDEERP